jgi:type VI protein secretion system component VasK
LNGKGAAFCKESLFGKYPFQAKGPDATREEIAAMFQPETGRFWKFVAELQDHVTRQGDSFAPNPESKIKTKISRPFLRFLDRAAGISKAFYGADPKLASFKYTVEALPAPEIDRFTLTIDNRSLHGSGRGGETEEFVWPGDASGVRMSVQAKGQAASPQAPSGPWAAVRLFSHPKTRWHAGDAIEIDVFPSSIAQTASAIPARLATLRLALKSKAGMRVYRQEFYNLPCESRVAAQ